MRAVKTLKSGGKPARKSVGRPRSFDEERAIQAAMNVFWRKGYEGASIDDLTLAMNMRPASLYGAFGSKKLLFEKALQRYIAGPTAFFQEAFEEPTALRVTERLLRESAEFLGTPRRPRGCMTIQTALSCG